MYFIIRLWFCFGQRANAKCEKWLPGAYQKETCPSLLASSIF
jgi:hypothetical protein